MRGISVRFGATVALAGIDFSVPPGEVHALIGENGAGKSTLMKVLSGALRPDAGAMWLNGQPYRPSNPLDARRMGVGMIYQELSLVPHLSVEENILLGLESTRWGVLRRRDMNRRVGDALERLEHPEIRPDILVGALSVAARQLVEIARALAVHCQVLVLDEPTSSLTRDDAERLFSLIRRLRGQDLAVVYISHFLEEIQQVADRFTVLRDGATTGGGAVRDTSVGDIVRLMVGRRIEELFPRASRTSGDGGRGRRSPVSRPPSSSEKESLWIPIMRFR